MGWTGRFGSTEVLVSLFIVAIAYAVAFKLWRTKSPWLVSGIVCVVAALLVLLRYMLETGFFIDKVLIDIVEWFVVGSVAGLVAMLVPEKPAGGTKKKPTYY